MDGRFPRTIARLQTINVGLALGLGLFACGQYGATGPMGADNSAPLTGLFYGGGFTVLTALEYAAFPAISHGSGFLAVEAALLGAMVVGNYFGGAVVWPRPPGKGIES